MIKIELTDSQVESLKAFIEYYFVQSIQQDEEECSLLYLYNIINFYDKLGGLEEFSDYEPCTK